MGAGSWMFSTSWHQLIITLPIFYIFRQLILKAVGEFYIKLPASFPASNSLFFVFFADLFCHRIIQDSQFVFWLLIMVQ